MQPYAPGYKCLGAQFYIKAKSVYADLALFCKL